ncbi:MAG: class I SAM-dependent DNA methyltransferase [Pyrobaculum sp.]
MKKEYIRSLLEDIAEDFWKGRTLVVEPTEALRERFRSFVDEVAAAIKPRLGEEAKKEPLRGELERAGYNPEDETALRNLARMMAYVFLNKLVFYKVLEKSYKLPSLTLDTTSAAKFREQLDYFFQKAVEVTNDFEPIFSTGLYDKIPIPDSREFLEYVDDFVATLDNVDLIKLGEQIGYIYEELIPPEERHQLGQFYTPPWVCELIVRWAVRSGDDVVLDPGVGSGGFLLKAYQRLVELKIGHTRYVPEDVHKKVLHQLYAVDINPFAAHLTAVNLSMRNVRAPTTELNVIYRDFFSLPPGEEVLAPYVIKTPAGEIRRSFDIPAVDAVVGNPPYTRWTEIPQTTRDLITKQLKEAMKKYNLTPQVGRGAEIGIYIYWIIHATRFLKNGGRLGMIISNTWLQTDYGIRFGKFLLDHYRIKAVIDFSARLFKDALVTTCIILAERESDEKKRAENTVAFIHIPGEVEILKNEDIDELLKAVETGQSEKYRVRLVRQGDIPRDQKWITLFFKTAEVYSHPLLVKFDELFEPSYGNVTYLYLASTGKIRGVRNPGAGEFHYLTPSKARGFNLDMWAYPNKPLEEALVYPAITNARQVRYFTFGEEDWEELCKADERCYMFIGHMPRHQLPKDVEGYVKWGETKCRTKIRGSRGGGKLCSQTEAAKARSKTSQFYGWYDLGGVIKTPIIAIRQAWHKSRFIWCKFPVATYDAIITLMPKIPLDELQIKALLAYLNSSFVQHYIETRGRKSPGGIIALELNIAGEMPILDVRRLDRQWLEKLARLFDELEAEARKIGGASEREQLEKLKPAIYRIDDVIAEMLNISREEVERIQKEVEQLIERRVSRKKKEGSRFTLLSFF